MYPSKDCSELIFWNLEFYILVCKKLAELILIAGPFKTAF